MGRVVGALILLASLAVAVIYGYLLFFSDLSILVLKLTVFLGVLSLLGFLGWVGYVLIVSERVNVDEVLKELEEDLERLGGES